MARKINFGTINADALQALNRWNVVDVTGGACRQTAKIAVTKAESALQAILDLRAQAVAGGMKLDDAVRKYSTVQAQADLLKAQDAYKAECKRLRDEQIPAKALVPADLYKAYVLKNQTGDAAPFVLGIMEFLGNMGINTPEVASAKFAETMSVRLGRQKASGKNKKDGHKTQDLKQAGFADMVVREFLEFCLNDKGVLDQSADGTLSYHDFEADEKAEKGGKEMYKDIMKALHPDNGAEDTPENHEKMAQAQDAYKAEDWDTIRKIWEAVCAQEAKAA